MRKFAFVILIALLAGSPLFAQRLSDEISADTYNDRDYGKMFTVDPAMKRFGVVLTNHSNRDVTVAHIHWKWIDANGKPGELTQEHNSFVTLGSPVVGARSTVLILPNATSMQAGQRGFTGGYLRLPAGMADAPTVTMSVDDVLLADGQVIEQDLVHILQEALDKSGAPGEKLRIGIPAGVVVDDEGEPLENLSTLHDLNMRAVMLDRIY